MSTRAVNHSSLDRSCFIFVSSALVFFYRASSSFPSFLSETFVCFITFCICLLLQLSHLLLWPLVTTYSGRQARLKDDIPLDVVLCTSVRRYARCIFRPTGVDSWVGSALAYPQFGTPSTGKQTLLTPAIIREERWVRRAWRTLKNP